MKEYHEAKKAGDTEKMAEAKAIFDKYSKYMGYGYLTDPKQIFPAVAPLFYAFHSMVALGFYFIILTSIFYYMVMKDKLEASTGMLKLALFSTPLPWLATSFGWMTAEIGRQPWTVFGLLPTSASVTPIHLTSVQGTFFLFLVTFVVLGLAELKILFRQVKIGPAEGGH